MTERKPPRKTARKTVKKAAAPKRVTRPRKPPAPPALSAVVTAALDDLKANNVTVLDVRGLTSMADTIVIASGTSDRHVKSLAGRVLERAREAGFRSLGVEGERDGEWVLVDLQDVIVHVMLPRVREFYGLEKLWDVRAGARELGT
jgi:ribosome-associated protein